MSVFSLLLILLALHDVGDTKRPRRSKKGNETDRSSGAAAFQQPKKDRENFRKALVDIIMQQDEKLETGKISPSPSQTGQELPPLSRTGSPSAAEKDILVCSLLISQVVKGLVG